jgi:hypothetical protein
MKPKVYVFATTVSQLLRENEVVAVAVAEDGKVLAEEIIVHRIYVRQAFIHSRFKLNLYNQHYPDGYELVDLIDLDDDQLGELDDLQKVNKRHHQI